MMTADEVHRAAAKLMSLYGVKARLIAELAAARYASEACREYADDWRRIAAAVRLGMN